MLACFHTAKAIVANITHWCCDACFFFGVLWNIRKGKSALCWSEITWGRGRVGPSRGTACFQSHHPSGSPQGPTTRGWNHLKSEEEKKQVKLVCKLHCNKSLHINEKGYHYMKGGEESRNTLIECAVLNIPSKPIIT